MPVRWKLTLVLLGFLLTKNAFAECQRDGRDAGRQLGDRMCYGDEKAYYLCSTEAKLRCEKEAIWSIIRDYRCHRRLLLSGSSYYIEQEIADQCRLERRGGGDSHLKGGLFTLKNNRRYCLGAPKNPRVGDGLFLQVCNKNNKSQRWEFENHGTLRLALHPELCVKHDAREVQLARCSNHQNLSWVFNYSENTLNSGTTSDYCASFRGSYPRQNAPVEMAYCPQERGQQWEFKRRL